MAVQLTEEQCEQLMSRLGTAQFAQLMVRLSLVRGEVGDGEGGQDNPSPEKFEQLMTRLGGDRSKMWPGMESGERRKNWQQWQKPGVRSSAEAEEAQGGVFGQNMRNSSNSDTGRGEGANHGSSEGARGGVETQHRPPEINI